jgi:rSAM/selenodomain-associated transferase 2
MTEAKVSVIVPLLNDRVAVESLLGQLGDVSGHCELIFSDGGSQDGGPQLIRAAGLTLVEGEAGRALQMNAGAAVAGGQILWFLHADSQLPMLAELYLEHIQAEKNWGFFDVRLSGSNWPLRLIERAICWRSRLTGVATGDQGIYVRRELFNTLGGYAGIALMEDVELSKRLRKHARPGGGGQGLYLGTSSRRWERHGVVSTVLLMWRLRLAYWLGADPERLAAIYYGR